LAAILEGDAAAWSGFGEQWNEEAFFRAADWHGLVPLLAERVARDTGDGCPPAVREGLHARAKQYAANESRSGTELRRALAALGASGIRPVVFKGTALAYTCYREPWLRPRLDTDILIAPGNVAPAEAVLRSLGYTGAPPLRRGAKRTQIMFTRLEPDGFQHALDIHWDIANRPILADAIGYDTLAERAEPVPALDSAALSPGPIDALMLAAIHRVMHHDNSVRLIWLHDIALLARRLRPALRTEFRQQAEERGVAAVCAAALCEAASRWQDLRDLGQWAIEWRKDAAAAQEPSAVYLTRKAWRGDAALWDVVSAPDWKARLSFLAAIVVPDSAYMLTRYGRERRWLLPTLHARRLIVGTWKMFGRLAKHLTPPMPRRRNATVSLTAKARVPAGVLVTELQGQPVLVNLDTDSVHGLDAAGAMFWEALTASESLQQALSQLQAQCDVDPDILRADLSDLVRALESKGLLKLECGT
jgi:hypothetical protein